MPIDPTWTDDQIRTHLDSLRKSERIEAIQEIDDNDTQQRCLDIAGLGWSDLGMINFGVDDSPAEQGPLGYGQDTVAGNGLWDGRYVFSVNQGVAYVYRDWDDIGTTPISQFDAPDLADGEVGVCESRCAEWVEYGVVEPLEAQGFLGHDEFRHAQQDLQQATQSFGSSLARLVRESGTRMTFRATTMYLIDGSTFGELFRLLEPVALHGTIEFTRNRTKPNVFSIFGLTPHQPPDGFDATLTGFGDDQALARVEQTIRDWCASSNDYPYRDGKRVVVEIAA